MTDVPFQKMKSLIGMMNESASGVLKMALNLIVSFNGVRILPDLA